MNRKFVHFIIAVSKSPVMVIEEVEATNENLQKKLAMLRRKYETVFVSESRFVHRD